MPAASSRPRDPRDCDDAPPAARLPCASAYQTPKPASTSGTSSRQIDGKQREGGERREPVLVEVPERVEQRGHREPAGMKLVQREPRRRRVEEVDEREAECLRARSRGAYARASRRAARRARSPSAWTTSSRSGLGHSHQSGAKSDEHRVDVRAEPKHLVAVEVVTRSGWPCAVDHTACTMFPRSKRPVSNERWRSIESAPNAAANARDAGPQTARGALR